VYQWAVEIYTKLLFPAAWSDPNTLYQSRYPPKRKKQI